MVSPTLKEYRGMLMSQIRWISFSGRALATVALMTTGGFLLHAQTASPSGTSSVQSVSAQEPIFEQTAQANGGELYSTSNAEMSGAAGGSGMDGRSTGAAIRTRMGRRSGTFMWAPDSRCRWERSSTMRRPGGD